jgi:glycosyltransferase involved in cell wall biosynthesis
MLVVDDGSTDETPALLKNYAQLDRRIRYYALDKNSGTAAARTKGMAFAAGRYIAFLDSDDLWAENKLEKQVSFMERTGVAFTCTSYEKMDEGGSPTGKVVRAREKMSYDDLLLHGPVGNSSVMYDALSLGKFIVPDIRKRNDYALWLQILKKEKFIYGMPDVLMQYRVRPGSLSSNKLALVRHHWTVYRDLEHLSVYRSVSLIAHLFFIKMLSCLYR